MVDGFDLEKFLFGGGNMELLAKPVLRLPPLSGSLKPTENRFSELLAASGSSQEHLGAPGIDSRWFRSGSGPVPVRFRFRSGARWRDRRSAARWIINN